MNTNKLVCVTLLIGMLASHHLLAQEAGMTSQNQSDLAASTDTPQQYYADALTAYQDLYQRNAQTAMYQGDYDTALQSYRALLSGGRQRVSPYWIGVQCESAGEVPVLSNIPSIGRLFHKGGLKINSVTDDSPAQKSGLKPGDVIVSFNGKAVNEIADLLAATGEAKTNEVEVQVIRADTGRAETLKVTPAERPEQTKEHTTDNANYQAWQQYWLAQQLDPGNTSRARYWLGTVYGYHQLPDDVEVTMHKKGKDPVRIVVKRDGQQWQVDSDADVRNLPTDVQTYIIGLRNVTNLGQNLGWIRNYQYPYAARNFYYRALQQPSGNNSSDKSDLLKRIEGLSQQLDELRKSVDQLKDK